MSLRELLAVATFTCLAIASLRAGGVLASVMIVAGITIAIRMAIVAFVGQGTARAYAIGFIVPMLAYAGTCLSIGESELDPYQGKLPTSRLLLPIFQAFSKQTWTDFTTGKVVPDYKPSGSGGGMMGGGYSGGFNRMMLSEDPDRPTFMSLGHVLIAVIFGFIGAKYSLWFYLSQTRQSNDTSG